MRLGLNIEYDGKSYDILELPLEAFVQMVPGLTEDQFLLLDKYFADFWPESTQRRHHILNFAAEQVGASLDYLLLNRESIHFDEADMAEYVQRCTKQGNRPS
ncbi:hypothetical protein GCM10025857_30930 [Alicyclobacillus contaminans]|uniref:hypothetical protein n=1 Tax=Alicyclobacillus contaminans TaxID=392016 RepID=UPI0003F91B46|nr:hypothetical protein [Alicyclobacillus contaminans]GMA51736.1 hypothetical protein GCM10025857_30930 [Alicyclobacillus contaminans]